jgi:nucleoid-associated protein YgaU
MSTFIGNPLLAFMQPASVSAQAFDPTSRYYGVPTATMQVNGQTVAYVTRRLLPDPNSLSLLQMYTVKTGDRLDQIAASQLGDPLQYWRICDANGAMRPQALTDTPGVSLRITLPQGVQGVVNG